MFISGRKNGWPPVTAASGVESPVNRVHSARRLRSVIAGTAVALTAASIPLAGSGQAGAAVPRATSGS